MMRSLTICLAVLLTGCATIMNGSRQRIPIASTPVGAKVTADNREDKSCLTPCSLLLTRRTAHTLVFDLDGYEKTSAVVDSSASGWLWGNLIFAVIPGLIVDTVSGGAWKLRPAQIDKTLVKK